jgi:hypothetical protein
METHGPVIVMKRLDKQVAGMFADPALSGDLLLVGIAMARLAAYAVGQVAVVDACRAAFGNSLAGELRGRAALASDVPASGAGGVLSGHLPSLAWDVIWPQVDVSWAAPAPVAVAVLVCEAESPPGPRLELVR